MERPTFSPFWHRVRAMKPRLRSHVQVSRQFYRAKRWHVAHDPGSNNYYRLSPVGYEMVCLMDGTRTVDEAWRIALGKHGDAAPTQHEVIELIGQLYSSNLLQIDAAPEIEQLLGRGRERVKKRVISQAVGIMYFKLRLFNPEAILNALLPIFRPVLSTWGLLLWALFVGFAIVSVLPKWDRLVSGSDAISTPGNWLALGLTYIVLKLWHELGHGLVCKRFGGQVPEFGAMLLVLLPSPFVDASSAWGFPNKWHRIAVGAGGMMFELFAAGVAAFVWLNTAPGQIVNQVAYFTMVTSGISTVLFNANPLMRFDGYYMLSDYLEIPNMMARSNTLLKALFQKYVFRLENVRPVSSLPGERVILFVFGVLSLAYRFVVFFSILMWLMGQWFGVGLVLAVWSFAAWFLIPVGSFVNWLASGAQLSEKRGRTLALTLGLIALVAGLLFFVPVPDWRRATGVIEPLSRRGIYAGTDGFVQTAHARPGQRVSAGDAILTLESPELASRRAQASADMDDLAVRLRDARDKGDATAEQIVRRQVESLKGIVDEFDRRASELVIRAPIGGVVVAADPARFLGAYVKKGEPICEVVETNTTRVHAVVPQKDAAWMFDTPRDKYSIGLRLARDVQHELAGGAVSVVPAGQRRLPHGALGFAGGGDVEVSERDPSGRTSKGEWFSVYVESSDALFGKALPGERVHVRFTLPSRPIGVQVVERVRKTLQGRVNL